MIMEYDVSALSALTILAQVILPIIVAMVTRTSAKAAVKAIALLALTAVTQLTSAWVDNFSNFDLKSAGLSVLVGFVISVATYFGLWKPTGSAELAGKVGPQ